MKQHAGTTEILDDLADLFGIVELRLSGLRDAIWERVLRQAPSERRSCEYCKKPFFPHRKDQRFCPGGKCSNAHHSQLYRDRHVD